MSNDIPVEVLNGCYPCLTIDCIQHALLYFKHNQHYSKADLGAYLHTMNQYFLLNGRLGLEDFGLVPEDSQAFYDKKLQQWLAFWQVDSKSVMGQQIEAINNKKLQKLA